MVSIQDTMTRAASNFLAPEHIRRIAPYAPGPTVAQLQRELGLSRMLHLAANENTTGPSPRVRDAIAQALASVQFYPDGSGTALRDRIAALHGLERANVMLGSGSGELVDILCRAFVEAGQRVVMSSLGFVQYRLSALGVAAELVTAPVRADRSDDPLAFASASRAARIVFIANPNNPTGTHLTRDELDSYWRASDDAALTVIDQAYQEYADAPDYPDALADLSSGRNVVVLRTFSKIYGLAGLRIGYALGPAEVLAQMEAVRPPFNANAVAQAAALAALEDPDHVASDITRNRSERSFLTSELKRRGYAVTPSMANFVLFDVPIAARDVASALARQGVLVLPATGYGLPNSLRVTVGTHEEMELFLAALDATLGSR